MNPSVQIPWLTLSKAADKITQMTGKPHSEADLLDAALDCRLSLSVQVPSLGIFARRGEFQAFGDDTPFGISTNVRLQYAKNGVAVTSTRSPFVPKIIEDAFFAYSTEEGDYVQGLFDLLLIGNGRAHIENLSKGYRGDCELIPLLPCGGVFLEGAQGAMGPIWEVQDEIISGEHQDPDHECEYAPADRFPPCWSVVVRTPEVARFYRGTKEYKMRATLRRSLRRQWEQDKEHFEIQKILSEHQPTVVGLISPEELREDHGINITKALRLGVEGTLRFYTFIKYATIVFGDFIEGAPGDGREYLDPQYRFDTGEGFYFQVAPATLEEMLKPPVGESEGQVQLIFPDALKGKTGAWKPGAPDVTYKSHIQRGFYRPDGGKYLDGQMGGKLENLCILKEDVAVYTRGINSNDPLAPEQAPVVPGDLISLTAASMMAGKSREELLEDVANGMRGPMKLA